MELSRLLFSFLIGGGICAIAELLIDLTKLTPARILVLLVSIGVFLGGVGLYDKVFDFAGAGISVPLIGFGGNIAKGVMDAIDKTGALGILTGPFTAASAGLSVSLVLGYTICLIFKGKPKKS